MLLGLGDLYYKKQNATMSAKYLIILRPQFFYFLFYGFSGPISDVGGRKKNKNKI